MFTPPMYYLCVLGAHVFNPICIPSASGHLPPHPCSVCLPVGPCQLLSLQLLPLFLGLTLNPCYERSPLVPPCASWVPQHQPPLSGSRSAQRPGPFGSLSRSGLCQSAVEDLAQPLLSLMLPRLQPCPAPLWATTSRESTVRRPSRLAALLPAVGPGPSGAGGRSWRWPWADGLWADPLLPPVGPSPFLLLEVFVNLPIVCSCVTCSVLGWRGELNKIYW